MGMMSVTASMVPVPPRGTMVPAQISVPPGHPTPYLPPPCDPYADAQQCHTALKANPLKIDGRTLINVICNRSINQLDVISAVYFQQFNHHLRHGIRDNTKTQLHLRKLLKRRWRNSHELKARALYKAVHNKGVIAVNDGRLVDVVAFTPNGEMPMLKAFVLQVTGQDIVGLVNRHTTDLGKFKDCMDILLQGMRNENALINQAQLQSDLQNIYVASDARSIGHDTSAFMNVLCRNAPWYNQSLNAAYAAKHKHDIVHAIGKTSMTSNTKALLEGLCKNPYEYYADRLYHAMKGSLGTIGCDDRTVVYIVSYLERMELQAVATIVKLRHPSHDLYSMFKSSLSGDYLHAVLALCGQPF